MQQGAIHPVRVILIDLLCFAAVEIPTLILFFYVEPYRRGFFCDDNTIRYPYKDSTVPIWTAYLVGLGCIPVIIFIECIVHGRNTNASSRHPRLWRSYRVIVVFGFGAFCCLLSTDIVKHITGRLRPYFIDVCQPDVNCDLPENKNKYIEEYVCVDSRREEEARLSFPSGHSSFSFYCMVYLTIYLEKNFTWKGSKLLKPILQFICILIAAGVALSRVSDYHHHETDVLAGSLLGIIIAVLAIYFTSDVYGRFPLELGIPNEINSS